MKAQKKDGHLAYFLIGLLLMGLGLIFEALYFVEHIYFVMGGLMVCYNLAGLMDKR
jgi:hypothetical protein